MKMQNKYAIIENNLVVNVTIASAEFAQSQGWVEMPEYVDGMAVGIGWFYVDNQFIPPAGPSPDVIKTANKQKAESLLQQTDWTEGKSVRDVTRATYLVNGDEFDDYRVSLRVIAVNPPDTEITNWPVKPDEQWSTQ